MLSHIFVNKVKKKIPTTLKCLCAYKTFFSLTYLNTLLPFKGTLGLLEEITTQALKAANISTFPPTTPNSNIQGSPH